MILPKGLLEFFKVLGPVFGSMIALFGGLGYFILDMYKFNVLNKINGSFPSQFTIYLFFICGLFAAMLVLGVLTFQTSIYKEQNNETNASA